MSSLQPYMREQNVNCVLLSLNIMWPDLFLQINVPDSVTKRFNHSISTYYKSNYCVWITVTGGNEEVDSITNQCSPITGSNTNIIMELGTIIIWSYYIHWIRNMVRVFIKESSSYQYYLFTLFKNYCKCYG